MAFNCSSPNSWRLFFIILLPMCWFAGLLLRHNEDLATPSTEDIMWTATRKPDDAISVIKAESSQKEDDTLAKDPSLSPLSSPPPPPSSSSLTPPSSLSPTFRWEGYSIKALAYVFPQFHATPENDRFWGRNFTEWNNVRKVTKNRFGLETLRPAPEVGYYSLLDYETRVRYARLVKESGLYGLVYHHYWFGYPVMDKPLKAILEDGEPNVPFMLSWDNEPWTVPLDGVDRPEGDRTLMAQVYGGPAEWKEHFDWMAPYFRHKNYVRNGATGKAQVMVHAPPHMKDDGKRMFEAWKRWAAQDPAIRGLDVIETHNDGDPRDRGQTVAMNEFGGRSGGLDDTTAWRFTPRLSPVYHRGTRVTWDNGPRHATDGQGTAEVWAHPDLWKINIIEQLRRVKLDPNPQGEENYFFINALNGWGEGNVLEASMQWGDRFAKAFREAKEYADSQLPWIEELARRGEGLYHDDDDDAERKVDIDVCVIIRDFHSVWPWAQAFDLSYTLRSLQAQKNERWRAVVVPVQGDGDTIRRTNVHVLDSWDPRVVRADVPNEIYTEMDEEGDGDGMKLTDWVIGKMQSISPSCAKARYMLVTNSTNSYEPETFDVATDGSGDIIGLNFVSEASMESASAGNFTWNQQCYRLKDGTSQYCQTMKPQLQEQELDLGAALIDFQRWQREGHKFAPRATQEQEKAGRGAAVLQHLVRRHTEAWAWKLSNDATCHLVHVDTYPACVKAGWIWVDIPEKGEYKPGCHRSKGLVDTYGSDEIPTRWDFKSFKRNPFCVRMSELKYEEVTSET